MKTIGIGVDIIENSRIATSIKKRSFIKRIFTTKEIDRAKNVKDKTLYYAKRFAAKEAFVKAIGTGFRNNINFKDISTYNDKLGKPMLLLAKNVESTLKNKFKTSSMNFFLSMSDEKKYSIAFVIFQIK